MNQQYIELKGVRVHNLKNIDLNIALNKLIVITGVSGSGKSSLAFDTLYAEGQRRYVESLSSYARQFLGRLNKPECDYIKGIPPAIAIEQKVNTSNPRSTVGTSTEIYDYLKLLYARAGRTYSPVSGKEVKRETPDDIFAFLFDKCENQTAIFMAQPTNINKFETLELLLSQGFSRIRIDNDYVRIDDYLHKEQDIPDTSTTYLVIDRITVTNEKSSKARIVEAIETALYEGNGSCSIEVDGTIYSFSSRFEADGIIFEPPTVNMFSFNSPIGACSMCEGYGRILGIDEDLVVPNKALSVFQDAVMCWRGEKMSEWKNYFIQMASKKGFPIHAPYYTLSDKDRYTLWNGGDGIEGINQFFAHLESKKYKIQNRVMIARYTGKTTCPQCHGRRLREEVDYIKIDGKSLPDLVVMPIDELALWFENIKLDPWQEKVAERVMPDIKSRLSFLLEVGLGYLTLNRLSSTLSGGESQRINLATSLGSALVGSLYILDEPSIGLHSRDTERLIQVLIKLRDMGNTVVVVEHDEDIIKAADEVIDIGPNAGRLGGEVVFQGTMDQLLTAHTYTAEYITGKRRIEIPARRRDGHYHIQVNGATENNLKNISVSVPLNVMTAITGVSGSGKSTLIKNILVPALYRHFGESTDKVGSFDSLTGDIEQIKKIEFIDQNPIGKSSRSNPVTYLKAWDDVRKLFADTPAAKFQGLKPAHFSFNVPGGRCEECQGEGIIKVEMQFMADVYLECEHCKGQRFKEEVLDIKFREHNIFQILEMTVNQGIEFFKQGDSATERSVVDKLQKLVDVGLGYIKLGQSSSTLSGGESQRVKLAFHLSKESADPTLFVFDEPTTGLHFHDINKLITSLEALIQKGHTVLVIEHNMDVIKCADYIIDLGPEGGIHGGQVIFQGTPEQLINCKESYTGKYLKEKLDNNFF
ncbi:MAG: excinuclease ABC subunit UvrA [Marinifilaceae bacterium]